MIANYAELDKRLTAHEAVCAERYGNIVARLGRVEKILIGVAGSLIGGMSIALWQIATVAAEIAGR
jgi:hypothetical protein